MRSPLSRNHLVGMGLGEGQSLQDILDGMVKEGRGKTRKSPWLSQNGSEWRCPLPGVHNALRGRFCSGCCGRVDGETLHLNWMERPLADVQGQREIPPESLPMTRTNHRHFQEGNRKTVFTWDIDKTYLATETDKLADLLRTALEFAIDKRELLGTVPLLKGLRRGTGGDDWIPPIYFVSASPSQMRVCWAQNAAGWGGA